MIAASYTLEQLRETPHISYSALNTYLNICQRQYYYRYVAKAEAERTSVALPFGSAFHAALSEQAQAAKRGKLLSVEELIEAFRVYFRSNCENSVNVIFKNDEGPEDLIATAGRMLEAVTQEWRDYWNIESVALPFRVEIPGSPVPLIGEIDMVVTETTPFDDRSFMPCLVDFKTAARMWPEAKPDRDLQATVFSYAFERAYGHRPSFRFDVITKTKKPAVRRFYTNRTPDDYARLEYLIASIRKAVSSGVFLPNETSFACTGCPYANQCRACHRSGQASSGKEVA
jgi:hypothetical protein